MSVDLTVVVPAYNEEQRLGPTLDAIRDHLEQTYRGEWELIVVDDGSTDRTPEIAAEASAADPRVLLISGDRNRGKGHALREGVLASYGRRVLVTDADLAAPIEELDHLDKALTDGHTAAIGSRARPGATIGAHQHRLRELLGRTGNFLIRSVAVPGIRDTQCGFKLFDGDRAREAFAASRLRGWGIDVEILQYFRRAGWPVAEVPVRWSHQEGSKVRPLDYVRVLAELTALKARAIRRADIVTALLFLALAVVLYAERWVAPGHRYIPDALQDQNQWEWFFAVTADNVRHLDNPLFTTLQNFPDGVNLMANTVMLGLSVPLAPVTWLLGPAVALNVAMTGGLAATALAWYWLILKRLVPHRGAAAVGAALAAFAPPMISHANAHPNFIVLFMIPLIIDRALRLCEGTRVVRDGIVLGLLAAYQVFLGEEPLLLAALGMLLFAAAYALARRDVARTAWRPLARGLGIALAVTLPLVAFPLYWQFFGPQSYKSVLHGDNAGNSPLAFVSFAERSLAGSEQSVAGLAMNPTEHNAFYGWPLLLLAFAIVVRLWDRAVVKALACTVAGAALLSLGLKFRIPLTDVVLPGPSVGPSASRTRSAARRMQGLQSPLARARSPRPASTRRQPEEPVAPHAGGPAEERHEPPGGHTRHRPGQVEQRKHPRAHRPERRPAPQQPGPPPLPPPVGEIPLGGVEGPPLHPPVQLVEPGGGLTPVADGEHPAGQIPEALSTSPGTRARPLPALPLGGHPLGLHLRLAHPVLLYEIPDCSLRRRNDWCCCAGLGAALSTTAQWVALSPRSRLFRPEGPLDQV
ncbi:Undecaprenyl-phosphate 4-deoxy-4-formamido-L-arabinose transferase [Streptomyces alboniger]